MRLGLSLLGVALLAAAVSAPGAREQAGVESNAVEAAQFGSPVTVALGDGVLMEFAWVAATNMWVGRHEVTNAQYRRFKPLRGQATKLNGESQPVVYVSWYDAMKFCLWLDEEHKQLLPPRYHFRLPTGAEWELFASCGESRTYPWGNPFPPRFGNYGPIDGYSDGFELTAPVTRSGANEWGLLGVGGNVWEWCYNSYRESKHHRMLRGGSWKEAYEAYLRTDFKNGSPPSTRFSNVGFRVVIGLGK
ncbi:MAG: SUMF1/EgtB/PvdO family nonheme iron enzyme [Kiritimatiellae bacterium]|nr:SUMF1/EgtB/PvdO family nonheme iron enzyme [Kiritimatiellia bacterium]